MKKVLMTGGIIIFLLTTLSLVIGISIYREEAKQILPSYVEEDIKPALSKTLTSYDVKYSYDKDKKALTIDLYPDKKTTEIYFDEPKLFQELYCSLSESLDAVAPSGEHIMLVVHDGLKKDLTLLIITKGVIVYHA